uniref:mRNA-decapping enzyme 1A isoform X2 n=1 Tax=Doryrhamphus excisus TaxID=161450 RepID=UPI0025AEA14C|nr:mRNA-decapping enzyme 1A isoform X2 [Doryrhamphus excisus]
METANAGHMMSLAALQRQDPYINKLLDVTGQVALYNFNSKANEWEKTEVEGTLFVYTRSASPYHGFTIMNRLSTENLVEPINKDLEFQLQDPFLLYKNGNMGIYSIWFYDKRDCHRIAQLMVQIVKLEADHAQRQSPEKAEPRRANGVAEQRPTDILELLSKAKEEYQRAQSGDADTSTEPNPTAALDHTHISQESDKTHTIVKQITIEELFGSSIPKDPSLPAMPTQNPTPASGDPSATYPQNQTYPPPPHQNPLRPPCVTAQDPGSKQVHQGHGLLPTPYAIHTKPVFQPVVPRPDPQPLCPVSPLMMPPGGQEARTAPAGPTAPRAYMEQEILNSLKPSVQSINAEIHKPVLAPNFLPSTLVPPHSFQEPVPVLRLTQDRDSLSKAPNLIKSISAVPMSPGLAIPRPDSSVLLSPSAFQQSLGKTTTAAVAAVPPPPSEIPTTSVVAFEPPQQPCSKAQLQDTLIQLIKNDAAFLGAIHDAYLQTVSKDFSGMKL